MDENLILNRISTSIHEKDPKAEAFLFGSRARGDHRDNSDWDLYLLINEYVTNEIEDNFRKDLYKIELNPGKSFQYLFIRRNSGIRS